MHIFSICLDESTDRTDISELIIFVRLVLPDFSVHEEMLEVEPLYRTTKGIYIFNLVKNLINEYVGFDKLTAVTTDGAKSMTGHISGLWGLMKRSLLFVHTLHYPPGSLMHEIF